MGIVKRRLSDRVLPLWFKSASILEDLTTRSTLCRVLFTFLLPSSILLPFFHGDLWIPLDVDDTASKTSSVATSIRSVIPIYQAVSVDDRMITYIQEGVTLRTHMSKT